MRKDQRLKLEANTSAGRVAKKSRQSDRKNWVGLAKEFRFLFVHMLFCLKERF
jgi:hypothetical protein